MRKTFMMCVITLAALLAVCCLEVRAPSAEETGESLFKKHCAGCHPQGGNIVNPQKTLFKKDLDANNISAPADIVKKMRNPGPFPSHPQAWAGMKLFDEKTVPDDDALKIANYILATFR